MQSKPCLTAKRSARKVSKKSGAGTTEVYSSDWKYYKLVMFVKDCAEVDDSTSALSIIQSGTYITYVINF